MDWSLNSGSTPEPAIRKQDHESIQVSAGQTNSPGFNPGFNPGSGCCSSPRSGCCCYGVLFDAITAQEEMFGAGAGTAGVEGIQNSELFLLFQCFCCFNYDRSRCQRWFSCPKFVSPENTSLTLTEKRPRWAADVDGCFFQLLGHAGVWGGLLLFSMFARCASAPNVVSHPRPIVAHLVGCRGRQPLPQTSPCYKSSNGA